MVRTAILRISLGATVLFCGAGPAVGQADSIEGYFTGKMVVAKIDMPGSEKGIDLRFDKPSAMDWNEYSSRLKGFGTAIHKGEAARITKINVKKDLIEFQLNGGGFGTAHDDTNTTVTATTVVKSQYEKDLEKQLADAKDPNKKRDLQHDLDRERARRERQDEASRNDALIASQMKAQQVAERRLSGGSRFNLRWQGVVPSDARNPQTVMKLLAEYVDFSGAPAGGSYAGPAPVGPAPMGAAGGPAGGPGGGGGAGGAAAQLKRGMKLTEVTALLGQGRVTSESVSEYGLKTQVLQYTTNESVIDVTSVEGVVVRYSISSN